jgi:predicted transcriptional regulator of viral defense system
VSHGIGWTDRARQASMASKKRLAIDRLAKINEALDDVPTQQIICRDVEQMFDMQETSARNVLLRLEQMGHLVKVRRGVWERVNDEIKG